MNKHLQSVLEWQTIFGGKGHVPSEKPISITRELAYARIDFIQEELDEYLAANSEWDLGGILDALVDLTYFINGMVVIHGLQDKFDEAFEIVHASNMSKLTVDGKVLLREDGKVLKSEQYWSPTEKLTELLEVGKGQR